MKTECRLDDWQLFWIQFGLMWMMMLSQFPQPIESKRERCDGSKTLVRLRFRQGRAPKVAAEQFGHPQIPHLSIDDHVLANGSAIVVHKLAPQRRLVPVSHRCH